MKQPLTDARRDPVHHPVFVPRHVPVRRWEDDRRAVRTHERADDRLGWPAPSDQAGDAACHLLIRTMEDGTEHRLLREIRGGQCAL